MMYATLYEEGYYEFNFTNATTGQHGRFRIKYQNQYYAPNEILTIQENVSVYEINLHIQTTDEDDDDIEPINIPPVADAGGPYYQIINGIVYFNGSESYDQDGIIITKYEWDFGDGTTSNLVSPNHIYNKIGKYTIQLIVTDDEEKTDIDITYAYITETLNFPPTQPLINGTFKGKINTLYNYTLFSTDIENNTIQYEIDWGDKTNKTNSNFLNNATIFTTNHIWANAGIYTLTAYAIDENNVGSAPTKKTVLINTIYCKNIGYMTDYSNSGFYEFFYSNTTKQETPVEFISGLYLIDDDNDGDYDYEFDIKTNNLSAYSGITPEPEKTTNLYDIILPLVPYLIFGVAIIIVLIVAFFVVKKFKKTKIKKEKKERKIKKKVKKKTEKTKEKATTKKQKKKTKKAKTKKEEKPSKEPKATDEELKKIRDKIDKL